ncbi:MAG: deoxyguanosinetriphosphate triphosphohydrolase [Rubrivivax sp.]|nr:deoxyguanosinetriphosphate triphosphohydrolase [Rubrivivax sp.]
MNLDALAPWACDPRRTRGRRVPEPASPPRNEHQRDRDRIVHSMAFRRLVYKTQVFINHEGDLFRTRLTHSLEVAQLARSAARALRLNEDLVEAIALAHDLGHTPFGHAGQDALHECMRDHGGFEHNLQSLRVVDRLEARYPEFDGLNLTLETRCGILKHCSRRQAQRLAAQEPGGPAQRFIDGSQPSLEAQVVNLADELAYNAHDIDDGVRSGLITLEQLDALPLFGQWHAQVLRDHPLLATQPGRRALFETLRRMLSAQIGDLVAATQAAIQRHAPVDAAAVAACPPLVMLSPEVQSRFTALKRFLLAELYRHPQVMQMTNLGRTVVADLFRSYADAPHEMPADYAASEDRPRAVADYIAGMTDRFAQREHHRLTGRRLFAL